MDTSLVIVLLCAFYISVTDAQNSSDDFIVDGEHYVGPNYNSVWERIDCECTPNGTFLPDYDGYVARNRETSLKRDQMVQVECSTINLMASELGRAMRKFTDYNKNYYPVAYRMACHRIYFLDAPCLSIFAFVGIQYLSLNGCSLKFPYGYLNFHWQNLKVLEIMDDRGLVVDYYAGTNINVIDYSVEYMLLKLFRWCPGNSNSLLIEEDIFPQMPVLLTFTAERCRLIKFPFGGGFLRTLQRSSHLELINLSHNDIHILDVFNTSQLKSPNLTLDFSHNNIYNVTSAQLELLAGRGSIYVNFSQNYIADIDIPDSHKFTKYNVTIDLSNNKITTINQVDFEHLVNATSIFMNLRNNPLDCDCRISFLLERSALDNNYAYLLSEKCASPKQFAGKYLQQLTFSDICPNGSNNEGIHLKLEMAISLIATCVVIIVVISVLIFKYRTEMRIVLYQKFKLVLPWESYEFDESKRYDAFVCYCNEDLEWVHGTFFPILTEGGNDFKICRHDRDFIPGKSIAENITDAIEWSRYTILILSHNFLRSKWRLFEFRSAFLQSLQERKRQMIFILLEEIVDDQMDSDLRNCLRVYTYIKAGDRFLRERMTYALSDKRRGRRDRERLGATRRISCVLCADEEQAAVDDVIQEDEAVL